MSDLDEDSSILGSISEDSSSLHSSSDQEDDEVLPFHLEIFLQSMQELSENEKTLDNLIEELYGSLFSGPLMWLLLEHINTFFEAARGDASVTTIKMDAWNMHEFVDSENTREEFLTRWDKLGRTLETFPNLKRLEFLEENRRLDCQLDYQAMKRVLQYATQVNELMVDFDDDNQEWEEFNDCIQGNESLTTIELFNVALHDVHSPVEGLLTLPNLEKVVLHSPYIRDMTTRPPSVYFTELFLLQSLKQIEFNNFHQYLQYEDYVAIGNALRNASSVSSLNLVSDYEFGCENLGISGGSAAPICEGLKTNTSLTDLILSIDGMDEQFYQSLGEALLTNKNLQKLCLQSLQDLDSNQSNRLCPLFIGLRGNSALTSLQIGGRLVVTPLLSNALCQCIENNKQLQILSFEADLMSDEAFRSFMLALQKNFSLLHMEMTKVGISTPFLNLSQTRKVETILRLNKAGRRYLIEDACSRSKGVEVLNEVKEDTDCSFFHLLENPSLCDLPKDEVPNRAQKRKSDVLS